MNIAQMTHHMIFCYILTFQGSENDDSKDGRNEMNFKVGMLNTWKSWMKLMLPYLTEVQVGDIYIYAYIFHVGDIYSMFAICFSSNVFSK